MKLFPLPIPFQPQRARRVAEEYYSIWNTGALLPLSHSLKNHRKHRIHGKVLRDTVFRYSIDSVDSWCPMGNPFSTKSKRVKEKALHQQSTTPLLKRYRRTFILSHLRTFTLREAHKAISCREAEAQRIIIASKTLRGYLFFTLHSTFYIGELTDNR